MNGDAPDRRDERFPTGRTPEKEVPRRNGYIHADRFDLGPETMLGLFSGQERPASFPSDAESGWDDQADPVEGASCRTEDPALIAAAVLIGRALSKDPCICERIASDAPVLILECPSEAWIGPAADALKRCFGSPSSRMRRPGSGGQPEKRHGAIVIRARSGRANATGSDDDQVERAFRCFRPLFGVVAPGPMRLPTEFEHACEARVVLGPIEPSDLTLVVRWIVGSTPSAVILPETAAQVGPTDLRIAVHPGRGPEGIIERLRCVVERRARKPASSVPRLSELRGFGEAAEWGLAAAADLAAYRRGLSWSACERGALLAGPPGVGKTMFAAALAREADVPFLAGSLTQWQAEGEAHLGTTLKAMRGFFRTAKEVAPCVALVDELDSFGDRRRLGDHNHHYAVQVVNGLLECLDGDDGREGVLLIGATNHPEWIDTAIVRAGRFDRVIAIEPPSLADLASILRQHLGADLPEVDPSKIARLGLGGTGADCAAWVRRARGRARRFGRALEEADLIREVAGSNRKVDSEELRRAAVHESGHAVVAQTLDLALGDLVLSSPGHSGDGYMRSRIPCIGTRRTLDDVLAMLMAGRSAEILVFGSPSAGAESDLARATALARDMLFKWGLGSRLAVYDPSETGPMFTARIERSLRSASEVAFRILTRRRGDLEHLTAALLVRKSLTGAEVETLLSGPRHQRRR